MALENWWANLFRDFYTMNISLLLSDQIMELPHDYMFALLKLHGCTLCALSIQSKVHEIYTLTDLTRRPAEIDQSAAIIKISVLAIMYAEIYPCKLPKTWQ